MNYRHSLAVLGIGVMVGSMLIGCASNRDYGTVIGGTAGAILGNQFGGGAGKVAATAVGAVAGAWVGSNIGAHLDDEDRRRLSDDTRRSAETGEPYSFYNPDTGVRGKTRVVRSETIDDRECRTVRQTIVMRDGHETTEDIHSCQ